MSSPTDNKSEISGCDVYTDIKNLPTTETDMLFDFLGNAEKLREDIKEYVKPDQKTEKQNDTKSVISNKSVRSNRSEKSESKTTSNYPTFNYKKKESSKESSNKSFKDEWYEKMMAMQKLYGLTQKKIVLTRNYTMQDSLEDMETEYNMHKSLADKSNNIKMMTNFMLNTCWGIEMANEAYNPFDFKLEGWSEQLANDTDEYYDVFEEIYEKYMKSGKKIPPEIKLVGLLMFSAGKYGMINSGLKSKPIDEELEDAASMREELRKAAREERLAKENAAHNLRINKTKEEFIQEQENIEKLKKQFEEFNNEQYYKEKLEAKQNLIKQKELDLQNYMNILANQNSETNSEIQSNSIKKTMVPPNLTRIQQQRKLDFLRNKNIPNKANDETIYNLVAETKSNSSKSTSSAITYNPDIENILMETSSQHSSGSKRKMREPATTITIS